MLNRLDFRILGAVLFGAVAGVLTAVVQSLAVYPPSLTPLPYYIVMLALMGLPHGVTMPIFAATYLALNLPLAFSPNQKGVPARYRIVLIIATALSAIWMVLAGAPSASISGQLQGLRYVLAVTAINVLALAGLWTLWIVLRRNARWPGVLAFATLFHIWLFGWAFPWFGEP